MTEKWSQAEVDAHNLRVCPTNRIPVPSDAVEDESELHADILAECRRRGWLALHGSMAHKAKRTAGEPDFIILTQETLLMVECKTRAGKLSTAQNALHAHARKLGHDVHVVRSFAEFLKLL